MADLRPGAKIAERYVLESVIARGGMGAVFKAIDERIGRTVAIKVLLDELAGDATSIARFEREATATARLSHPGIVQMFDFGKSDGVSYIVMEYVVGRTLATELEQRGRIAPVRACELIEQALAGLSAAHEAGIVHRDIKPGNIMIVPTGSGASAREVVKVLDFGIAQLKDSKPYTRLTKLGAVLGTPTFMSPEQARGEPSDPRTDVYATGIVLWCCLTGQRPFHGADVGATLKRVLGEMPPRADHVDPSIPAPIAEAVQRAVEKRADARWPTALAFAGALAEARAEAAAAPSERPSAPSASLSSGETSTREVTHIPAPSTIPSAPPTRPGKPSSGGIAIAIVVALGVLAVLGIVVVVSVVGIEFGQGALSSHDPTPPPPHATPVMLPSSAVPTAQDPPRDSVGSVAVPNVVVTADACARLARCCESYRLRDRDIPACDELVGRAHESAEDCARQMDALAREAPELEACASGLDAPRRR
jgi:serine/threonine-protein kinase